jgi:hypothetical protein
MISPLAIYIVVILLLSALVWAGLWRLYRWLFVLQNDLAEEERSILERQLLAMAVYFPIHLSAIVLPVDDRLRGMASIMAAFTLGYIGVTAVRHRLFVAFNRQSHQDAAAVREGLAVAAGWLMLVLAAVVLALGMWLLNR